MSYIEIKLNDFSDVKWLVYEIKSQFLKLFESLIKQILLNIVKELLSKHNIHSLISHWRINIFNSINNFNIISSIGTSNIVLEKVFKSSIDRIRLFFHTFISYHSITI